MNVPHMKIKHVYGKVDRCANALATLGRSQVRRLFFVFSALILISGFADFKIWLTLVLTC
jgi:hypothetical protein